MQIIWSRAAQTRSCRCNACLHSASNVARRTMTAASKRRLRVSDVFTLCYSAMFATAAVVEAERKDKRRKKWDRAIEEAKARSGSGSATKSTAALDWAIKESRIHSPVVDQIGDTAVSVVCGTSGKIPSSTTFPSPVLDGPRWDLSETSRDNSADGERLATKDRIQTLSAADNVWDEEGDQAAYEGRLTFPNRRYRLSPREPRTRTHLDSMARMVVKLVQNLLDASGISSSDLEGAEHTSPKIPIDRPPTYGPISQQTLKERMALNISIETILRENLLNDLSFDVTLSQVCYILLSSSAPPNIVTYNLMIVHFTRLRQHHHAQAVVDSLLYESQFRPNSRTISAVLDHYIAMRRTADFQQFTKRMRALDGDMNIRRVHISFLQDPKIQAWAEKWKATHRSSYLYAKVHRDSMIFESLIRGAIMLFEMKWAVMYFQFAFREGCHITINLFCFLARTCFRREDQRQAAKILSVVVSRWYETEGPPILESHGGARKRIYMLLELCGVLPSKALTSHELLPKGLPDIQTMRPWLYCLRTESISSEVARMAEIVDNLEIMVSKYLSRDTDAFRIRRHVLQQVNDHLEILSDKKSRFIVEALEKATSRHSYRLESLIRQFVGIIYRSLLVHDQEIYDEFKNSNGYLEASEFLKMIVDLRSDSLSTSYRSLSIVKDRRGSSLRAFKSTRPSLRTSALVLGSGSTHRSPIPHI